MEENDIQEISHVDSTANDIQEISHATNDIQEISHATNDIQEIEPQQQSNSQNQVLKEFLVQLYFPV